MVEPGSAVRCDGERITVVKEGKTLVSTPVRRIAQVAILTNAALTTPAIRLCARFHVPIYLADPYGGGDAVFQHAGDTRIDVLRAQFAAQADAGARLTIAKGFVAGKLHNQLVMLRRYARHRAGQDAARHGNAIRQIAAQAALANSLDVLRGCEGFAAKSYFAGLRALLGADWGFDARIARGSADPFNSALSFTYSLLCRAVLAELRATGFDARIGLFHEARPGHPALASDLMEEFRPLLADSVVLNAFLNGDLAPGDFHQTQAGLRLLPASVKKVVHAFETKLAARVTVAGADGETCYRDAIHTQSTLLAEALAGRAVYRPFKAR